MVIFDGRISTRLVDYFFTRTLIQRARTAFILSKKELSSVLALGLKSNFKLLPNGIEQSHELRHRENSVTRIVFCSRIEKRKEVIKFIDLADAFRLSDIKFEIYGPDGGELHVVKREIENRELNNVLEYKGALAAQNVQKMLAEIDLLVLPSRDEPFPMVVLEALSVGTAVLIMPSCGIADALKNFDSSFVAETEDLAGLVETLNRHVSKGYSITSSSEIIAFCNQTFGIKSVIIGLMSEYEKAVNFED
jgi:glycosyltransferase involved in cell wall biosynthesis